MKILVCGGRNYNDRKRVNRTLDDLLDELKKKDIYIDDLLLIEGGARGADALAREWARSRGIHVATIPALWDTYSRGAGHRRNAAMLLLQPNMAVAFPGGPGTANMVKQAAKAGIVVMMIEPEDVP